MLRSILIQNLWLSITLQLKVSEWSGVVMVLDAVGRVTIAPSAAIHPTPARLAHLRVVLLVHVRDLTGLAAPGTASTAARPFISAENTLWSLVFEHIWSHSVAAVVALSAVQIELLVVDAHICSRVEGDLGVKVGGVASLTSWNQL